MNISIFSIVFEPTSCLLVKLLIFDEIYPESIADFNIIEKFDVICCVEWEYKSMLNKGFTIENFYSIKGVYLNRPSQKKMQSLQKLKQYLLLKLLQQAFMSKD